MSSSHLYLFGRVVSVKLLSPQLGIHLKFDILKVYLAVNIFHVSLGHIVRGMLPVLTEEGGVLLSANNILYISQTSINMISQKCLKYK